MRVNHVDDVRRKQSEKGNSERGLGQALNLVSPYVFKRDNLSQICMLVNDGGHHGLDGFTRAGSHECTNLITTPSSPIG